jgi:hypothetical protein
VKNYVYTLLSTYTSIVEELFKVVVGLLVIVDAGLLVGLVSIGLKGLCVFGVFSKTLASHGNPVSKSEPKFLEINIICMYVIFFIK